MHCYSAYNVNGKGLQPTACLHVQNVLHVVDMNACPNIDSLQANANVKHSHCREKIPTEWNVAAKHRIELNLQKFR